MSGSSGHGLLKGDYGVASSRCSIRHLYDVICRFDERKKQLVRSIGFDDLLYFPDHRQINRRLSVWLMSRVQQMTKHLVIDGRTRIKFTKEDIGVVFGIPSSGRSVLEEGGPSKETVRRMMVRYFGAHGKENRSIKVAQEVLERRYDGIMSLDEDCFQVLYLDSIDLGSCNLDHNLFPRIRCFSSDRIRSMILADSGLGSDGEDRKEFGTSKLRSAYGICCEWAREFQRDGVGHVNFGNSALWEATISLARALNVPLEATGPLYLAVVDFETDSSHLTGFGRAPLLNTIFSIIEAYVRSFSYNTGIDCISCVLDGSSSEKPEMDGSNFLCGRMQKRLCSRGLAVYSTVAERVEKKSPGEIWNANFIVRRAMYKYYLCVRQLKVSGCIDLNALSYDDGSEDVIPPKKDIVIGDEAFDSKMPCLVHFVPKFIQVKPAALKEQLKGHSEMEMDLFDAIIRRFKQCDDMMYADQLSTRWRHFVESDFIVIIVDICRTSTCICLVH